MARLFASGESFPEQQDRTEIEEFRVGALRMIVLGLPSITMAIVGAFALDYYGTPIQLATLVLVPIFLAVGAHALLGRRVGALLTIFGLLSILTFAVWLTPDGLLATLYCLVVLVAGATIGARAGFATAVVAIGLIAVFWRTAMPPMPGSVALASAVLALLCAILGWIATNPIYVALQWAWQSYDQSRKVTEELRDRQGELGRVVKSLNEAYLQLEHLNDELAKARLIAEEARRLKSQFAANISHELRTPLNLIIGFSEMMASAPQVYGGKSLPDAYRSDLDAILRNARHLSGLIDDVLDLSQIEASRMGLVKEPVAIGEVIGEAAGAVARLLDGRGLSLNVNVPDDLPIIYVDRTRIRQVLINLLGNAVRFTDHGGITVNAAVEGTDVRVSVEDTGIGIAEEDIPKAFEQFRQIDGTIRRRAGGTGLGLAVSKQFVELHGGAMWAESRLGEGTVFYFTLPVATNVVAAVGPGDWKVWDRMMAARPHEPAEVRVVSADPSVARIFQRHLDGYRVTEHASVDVAPSSPAGAWVIITPDVVEAYKTIERPSDWSGDAPVIACVLPDRRDFAVELGVSAHLMKPVSRDQLAKALSKIGTRPRSVLVVDDDADMLRLLGRWIRSLQRDCQIWLAGGGDEAIAILRSRRPDAVVLDLVMPEVNGMSVLEVMRADERLRDVPTIVVTAHQGQEEAVTAGLLAITRSGGMSIGDLMRCLKINLDVLLAGPAGVDAAPGVARTG